MMEVYNRSYYGKIRTDVTYYFNINTRGVKKYYETVYESISNCGYTYSRYEVVLSREIKNSGKVENDVYRYTPILFQQSKAQRRLSILAKFVLYIISVTSNIPIYRIPEEVLYHHDGINIQLSVNSFVKTTYELVSLFEKVYKG